MGEDASATCCAQEQQTRLVSSRLVFSSRAGVRRAAFSGTRLALPLGTGVGERRSVENAAPPSAGVQWPGGVRW